MFYAFVRIICRLWLRIYYGKIEVNGLENIPKETPILLACNHPTGFLEPIIVACVLNRPLHFLTRGDLFSGGLLTWLLRATNQIPIWRFKDGYSGLKKNAESIQYAKEALTKGGALMIFVEGRTEDVKMLKPLQKGLARISHDLLATDFHHLVVPIGINFLDSVTPRSNVFLNFGKPVSPDDVYTTTSDQREFMTLLTSQVYDAMKPLILHVERTQFALLERLVQGASSLVNFSFRPFFDTHSKRFHLFKELSDSLHTASDDEASLVQNQIDEINFTDKCHHLLQPKSGGYLDYILLFLLLPFAICGILVYSLPLAIGWAVENRLVKSREFIAPIRFAVSMGAALVLVVSATLFLLFYIGWWGVLFPFSFLFLIITTYWFYLFRRVSSKYRLDSVDRDRLVAIFTLLKIDIGNHLN